MKFALYLVFSIAVGTTFVWAEEEKSYYIERYPNDGMNQRPKMVPSRTMGESVLRLETASTNSLENVGTNSAPTKAARYITPRVSSKSWLPSRKPQPKEKIVVVPTHGKKIPPPPTVTEKPGVGVVKLGTAPESNPTATNSPAAATDPQPVADK